MSTATTTDTPEIRPALNEEQWRNAIGRRERFGSAADHETATAHGVAALMLHEHPAGFGWPDRDLLVDLADKEEVAWREADDAVGGLHWANQEDKAALMTLAAFHRDRTQRLRSLAARITALLAPP